jgi:hypothetical protein
LPVHEEAMNSKNRVDKPTEADDTTGKTRNPRPAQTSRRLDSSDDVRRAVAYVARRLEAGSLDDKTARPLLHAYSILLTVFRDNAAADVSALAARVVELERLLAARNDPAPTQKSLLPEQVAMLEKAARGGTDDE